MLKYISNKIKKPDKIDYYKNNNPNLNSMIILQITIAVYFLKQQ